MRMYKFLLLKNTSLLSLFLLCFLSFSYSTSNAEESTKLQKLNLLIQTDQLSQAAQILATMDQSIIQSAYGHYNLGIALISHQKIKAGIALLGEVIRRTAYGEEQRALKEKAHLISGQTLLKNKKPFLARKHFIEIPNYSLFYSEALLGSGQTSFALKQYQQALESWSILQKQPINSAVLESLYLIPDLLFKLGFYNRSLNEYQYAIEQYKTRIHTLESAITDLNNLSMTPTGNIQPNTLFKPYINHYLIPLLASHSFQQEIEHLNKKTQSERKIQIKALNQSAISILEKQKKQLNNYLADAYLATAQIYDKKASRASGGAR